MSTGTKWRISDIIEAIEREREAQGLSHNDMGPRLRHWAGGEDRGPLTMLRAWFQSIPASLGLPLLPWVPGGTRAAEIVTPEVEAVFQKLVSEAKRLDVPKRG